MANISQAKEAVAHDATENYDDDDFEEDDDAFAATGAGAGTGAGTDEAPACAGLPTTWLGEPTLSLPPADERPFAAEPPAAEPPAVELPAAEMLAMQQACAPAEEQLELPRPARLAPWSLITLDELDLGELLGSGGNGTVHAAHWQGQRVAVKTLKNTTSAQLAVIEAELLVQAPLIHRGIVRLLGACLVPPSCCIVLEHCDCSLFHRLYKDPSETSRHWLLAVALGVAEAMQYLHAQSPPLIHRDLKSPNVLLQHHAPSAGGTCATEEATNVKICDFGLVGVKEPTAGTPNYMAPELLEARSWSGSVDVYAFAILLNELFTREVPWDGFQPFDIKQRVVAGERPRISLTMPLACERLVQAAWHRDPAARPTFDAALSELQTARDNMGSAPSHDLPPLPPDSLDALM